MVSMCEMELLDAPTAIFFLGVRHTHNPMGLSWRYVALLGAWHALHMKNEYGTWGHWPLAVRSFCGCAHAECRPSNNATARVIIEIQDTIRVASTLRNLSKRDGVDSIHIQNLNII